MSDKLQAALVELRRPFTPAAVKWKIQVNPKQGKSNRWSPAIIVGFIDSRLVAERLNHVVGGDWSDEYGTVEAAQGSAFVTCRLSVLGATREDVGWSNGVNGDMAVKAVYSDAFKRAAVKFSIGAFLYAMPTIKLWENDLESWGEGQNRRFALSDQNRANLSERYSRWAGHERNVERFGTPIDHGDVAAAPPSEPGQASIPGVSAPAPAEGLTA